VAKKKDVSETPAQTGAAREVTVGAHHSYNTQRESENGGKPNETGPARNARKCLLTLRGSSGVGKEKGKSDRSQIQAFDGKRTGLNNMQWEKKNCLKKPKKGRKAGVKLRPRLHGPQKGKEKEEEVTIPLGVFLGGGGEFSTGGQEDHKKEGA